MCSATVGVVVFVTGMVSERERERHERIEWDLGGLCKEYVLNDYLLV